VQRHGCAREGGRLISLYDRVYKGASVSDFETKGQRFIALCMLGMLLFNYPVLTVFNVSGTLFGVPVLYSYLFIAWAGLIALVAYVAESGG